MGSRGDPYYSSMLVTTLPSLFSSLADSTSAEDTASLLSLTNQSLIQVAKRSFKVIDLSKPHISKKPKFDPALRYLSCQISKLSAAIKKTTDQSFKHRLSHQHQSVLHGSCEKSPPNLRPLWGRHLEDIADLLYILM